MASPTLARTVPEKTMLTVCTAAQAVIAHKIGLPIEAVCSSKCWLPPYVSEHSYANPTDEDRKHAQFFIAGIIAKQKLSGEPLVMKTYELDNLPEVLRNAVGPVGDWFHSDDLIYCQLNMIYLTTRDLLRDGPSGLGSEPSSLRRR